MAALHRAFTDLVDGGLSTLIEPGAGTGRVAIPALAAGFRVTALDLSPPMLNTLRQRLAEVPEIADRCSVITGEACVLPFDDDRFDAGVLAQVLYLIPEWRRALNELVRVVRPGGTVLLVQERTSMSHELQRWDAAWRGAMERAGYEPIEQVPDDATAVAALAARTSDMAAAELASWAFGHSVGDALAGLDKMRPLYASLSDDAWDAALASFRAWYASSGLGDSKWLGGTVTLTLVSGTIRAEP